MVARETLSLSRSKSVIVEDLGDQYFCNRYRDRRVRKYVEQRRAAAVIIYGRTG